MGRENDCISRAEVLKLMQDNWHTHNGDWAMQESMDDIRALPSVTPIRPKGHWIDKFGGVYRCSCCREIISIDTEIEFPNGITYKYCPYCGSDNREVEE